MNHLCYSRNKFTFYRQNEDMLGCFSRPSQLQRDVEGLRLGFRIGFKDWHLFVIVKI